MIKLTFEIYSIFYGNEIEQRRCTKINVTKKYPNNKKLREVLKELYYEYEPHNGIYNYDWENRCDIFNINELLWKQYFSYEIVKNIDYAFSDYKEMTIRDLEKQFSISNILIPVFLNKDKGASVGKYEGIEFFFHTREKDLHHKAHIHCKYNGIETRVDLNTLELIDKSFKKKKMAIALEKIKNNKNNLLNYWNKVVINGESMKFKMKF